MKLQLILCLFFVISACKLPGKSRVGSSCFHIETYPEFRMGEKVDTGLVPFDLLPFETLDPQYRELLSYSHAYLSYGFDGPVSSLIFTIDSTDQTLNSLMVMWAIMDDPKDFMNRLRETYLPCLPVTTLLLKPNEAIQFGGGKSPEFFKYSKRDNESAWDVLHYWVGF